MNSALLFSAIPAPARAHLESSRLVVPVVHRSQAHLRHKWVNSRLQVRAFRPVIVTAQAGSSTSAPSTSKGGNEFIEVVLEKPLGLRFARGNDGRAYVIQNDAKLGNTDKSIEVGDRISEVSASFGDDVWEAQNYGQVMYAIRTRNGGVYLKIQKMFGDLSALQEDESSDMEKMWRKEQAGGNVGLGTREVQQRNYEDRKKSEAERKGLFNNALKKFKSGEVENALIDFENIISLEPRKFMSDSFARVSEVCMLAHYNAACCYASLGNTEAGLESLTAALDAGYDDYQKVRNDPNLEGLRKSDEFTPLVNKYDEPIINENAVKVLKGLFSFGKSNDD